MNIYNLNNIGSKIISSFSFSQVNQSDHNDINMKINLNYSYPHDLNKSESIFTYAELLFTRKSGVGWAWAISMPTGWALLAVLIIIVLFALPCIRKKGYFQVKIIKKKIRFSIFFFKLTYFIF